MSKFLKNLALVLSVAVLSIAAIGVSESASVLITDEPAADQFTNVLPGGIEITFIGIRKKDNAFDVSYIIKPSKDIVFSIEIENSTLKDANDAEVNYLDRAFNKYDRKNIGAGVYINGKQKDTEEGKAGESYQVVLRYIVDRKYVLTKDFPYVSIAVNGLLTVFNDVPVAR
jgi:hypothetical protein